MLPLNLQEAVLKMAANARWSMAQVNSQEGAGATTSWFQLVPDRGCVRNGQGGCHETLTGHESHSRHAA